MSFFFVLSGFILAYIYRDFSGHSVRSFYLARFARLWPVHVVTFLLAAAFVMPHALGKPLWQWTIPINLTLTQAWFPLRGLVTSWNGVSWSISAEAWFYILFPFLAATTRPATWLICIAAIVASVVMAVQLFPLPRPGLFDVASGHIIQQHPAVRMLEFVVGVMAGRLYNAGYRIKTHWPTLLEFAALSAVLLYAVTSTWVYFDLARAGWRSVGLWYSQSGGCVAFALAIYVFAQGGGLVSRALSWKGFVLLGEISFSTYMVHHIIVKKFAASGAVDAFGWLPAAAAMLIAVYSASWLLWRFVEVPCRRWILAPRTSARTQAAE